MAEKKQRSLAQAPDLLDFSARGLVRVSSVKRSSTFAGFNTADDTKYYYILAALDQSTVTRLLDLISQPPADAKYETLKDRLIDTFGLSKRERVSRRLYFRPLGDSKPSTLMDEMLALLGDHPPCLLFEQLFLERLPEDIRIQLVESKIEDHRQLAKRADALYSQAGTWSPTL